MTRAVATRSPRARWISRALVSSSWATSKFVELLGNVRRDLADRRLVCVVDGDR